MDDVVLGTRMLTDILAELVAKVGQSYPGYQWATFVVHLGDGLPDVQIPVTPADGVPAAPAARRP